MRLKATAYMGELGVPCVITNLRQRVRYLQAESPSEIWDATVELEREQCDLLDLKLPEDKRVLVALVPTYYINLAISPAESDIRINTTWIKRGVIGRVLARLLNWPKRNTVGLTDMVWRE